MGNYKCLRKEHFQLLLTTKIITNICIIDVKSLCNIEYGTADNSVIQKNTHTKSPKTDNFNKTEKNFLDHELISVANCGIITAENKYCSRQFLDKGSFNYTHMVDNIDDNINIDSCSAQSK